MLGCILTDKLLESIVTPTNRRLFTATFQVHREWAFETQNIDFCVGITLKLGQSFQSWLNNKTYSSLKVTNSWKIHAVWKFKSEHQSWMQMYIYGPIHHFNLRCYSFALHYFTVCCLCFLLYITLSCLGKIFPSYFFVQGSLLLFVRHSTYSILCIFSKLCCVISVSQWKVRMISSTAQGHSSLRIVWTMQGLL